MGREEARAAVGPNKCLQGNMDPAALYGSPEVGMGPCQRGPFVFVLVLAFSIGLLALLLRLLLFISYNIIVLISKS